MIYMFDKGTNKFEEEFESVEEAAKAFGMSTMKIQSVLNGSLESIKGKGLIYKPEVEHNAPVVSYYISQKETFLELTDGNCTWDGCVTLINDDVTVYRKTINVSQGIKMLRDGFTAIPF